MVTDLYFQEIHQREKLLPVIQGQNPVRSTVALFPVPGHGAGGLFCVYAGTSAESCRLVQRNLRRAGNVTEYQAVVRKEYAETGESGLGHLHAFVSDATLCNRLFLWSFSCFSS